jgi:hypothetical protein
MSNVIPLEARRAALLALPNYFVSGGGENLAIASGDLVSPERSSNPTGAGVTMFMVVRVEALVVNTHASQLATRSAFGGANLLKRMEYTDPDGYLRHTGISGRALEMNAQHRQADVVGGSSVIASNYGMDLDAGGSDVAPLSIAANTSATISHTFIIPFAVGQNDCRGAVANVLSTGQQTLKLTFPTKAEAFVPTGADAFNALYVGGTMSFASLKYEVISVTKNRNLPSNPSQMLPVEDFADVYMLQEGARTNLVAGVDTKIPMDANRRMLSAFYFYNNGGTLNRETDVTSLSVLAGGSQDLLRCSPKICNMFAKNVLTNGLPPATYYQDFRRDNMDVANKGSIDLVFMPATVNSGATLYTLVDYIQYGAARVVSAN